MRTLGRLGAAVHWVHPPLAAAAERSRYAAGTHPLNPTSDSEETLDYLADVARTVGGRPILIPTDDLGVYFVDDHADELASFFRFPAQPRGLPARLADKRKMHDLCIELDVPTPETSFPESAREAVGQAEAMSFPVVLKGADTTLLQEITGTRMVIVHDADELARTYDRLGAPGSSELMVQSYIPGPPHSVWMFNGYFDADSRCRFGGCGRKLRQAPPYTGATSLGISAPNPVVYDTTVRLMEQVGYRGILDIGYRYDERDGQYKLLDVNPRLGATFRLWVGPDGLDVVRALYLDFTGQPIPAGSRPGGRKWLLETSDIGSSWTYCRDRRLTVRRWLSSLRGIDEMGWFSSDDRRPAAHAYGAAARKLLVALVGEVKRRWLNR